MFFSICSQPLPSPPPRALMRASQATSTSSPAPKKMVTVTVKRVRRVAREVLLVERTVWQRRDLSDRQVCIPNMCVCTQASHAGRQPPPRSCVFHGVWGGGEMGYFGGFCLCVFVFVFFFLVKTEGCFRGRVFLRPARNILYARPTTRRTVGAIPCRRDELQGFKREMYGVWPLCSSLRRFFFLLNIRF